jgi:hypothetical protein
MTYTRRRWFTSVLGAVSMDVVPQRSATPSKQTCSGTVRRPDTNPVVGAIVQLIQPDGQVMESRTNSMGEYAFTKAATAGPYLLVFRESQGHTKLHEVRQLTAGTEQTVSVTVDPDAKTFHANYDALQSLEALCTFALANANKLPTQLQNEVRQIPAAVAVIRGRLLGTAAQLNYLKAKADSVEQLSRMSLG